ncbi:MAG: Dihydroorotate dehydrogenase B (NAD(+)), catalytic subunit [candidate division WS2 bacterium ADurb.Bin280]|uniref:Dihydroorotate dehydrogenase B (NAD(+)), catalytic subunit n=1 Tax=candidate division WS2 bacterium ADurb.Bin280 TaxID=1852829 RepID=A0A1V5SC52_9BACT|nr:MAG: Dihydroorotate dehydrogenase B (NAD(+)), catalytic subunit [candidate division WS2 bacterium ADurb.Bin280]
MKLGDSEIKVVLDSGVLGLDGLGYFPERLAILTGELRPRELAAISKTVTFGPHAGNFRWWKPWESIRYLGNGNYVNTYGLTNPGIVKASKALGRFCSRVDVPIISVALPAPEQAAKLVEAVHSIRPRPRAIELNISCPNVEQAPLDSLVDSVGEIRVATKLPLIIKLGYDQDFISILDRLYFVHDVAHLINSVRFSTVFSGKPSPLKGGGGVSGPIIFEFAVNAVEALRMSDYGKPIIGGGGIDSVDKAKTMLNVGADAIAIGTATHTRPYLPNHIKNVLAS